MLPKQLRTRRKEGEKSHQKNLFWWSKLLCIRCVSSALWIYQTFLDIFPLTIGSNCEDQQIHWTADGCGGVVRKTNDYETHWAYWRVCKTILSSSWGYSLTYYFSKILSSSKGHAKAKSGNWAYVKATGAIFNLHWLAKLFAPIWYSSSSLPCWCHNAVLILRWKARYRTLVVYLTFQSWQLHWLAPSASFYPMFRRKTPADPTPITTHSPLFHSQHHLTGQSRPSVVFNFIPPISGLWLVVAT